MHAKQLAALGGWIAGRSESIIQSGKLEVPSLTKYWVDSRLRFQRWHTALKVFHSDLSNPQPQHNPWPAIKVVVQEIFLSELLTRVWSSILYEHDKYHHESSLTGIANATYVSHVEVRNRALQLLLRSGNHEQKIVGDLNRLRNRIERWTDLWLSLIDTQADRNQYAFEPSRVTDFQLDVDTSHLSEEANEVSKQDEATLMFSSFTSSLNIESIKHPANPDLNHRIAAVIISTVPTDRFDSFDIPQETWMLKMEKSHHDLQTLVDQLLSQVLPAATS